MKFTALVYTALFAAAQANIIFNHVPLTCTPHVQVPVQGQTGCLRGQICDDGGR